MVPKFKTTEITPTETLGEKLKRIRGDLKLSLDDVERATKIRKKYLKAIESNDYSSLPADVYMRGFLKNYSKILGISEEKVLDMYKKERGIVDNISQAKKKKPANYLKSPKVIITPRTFVVLFTAIAGLAIISYIAYEIFIFNSSPKLNIISPSNNAVVKKSFVDITGKTDQGTDIYINGQKVNTSEEGDFKVSIGLGQKGVNLIKVLAKNIKNGKTTEKSTNVVYEPSEVAIPEVGPEKATGNLKFTLKVGPGTAWISVKKDGVKEFEGIMLPGTMKEFEASQSIVLTSGNGGSTQVIFQGKDFGKIGKEDEIITDLVFDSNTLIK